MSQVRSRQRVADYGEVFTSEEEVNAMLDLVESETRRIDSRFLEPACGTGNFLIEILKRKMKVIFDNYNTSQTECEKNLLIGIGSLYGIDCSETNIQECRKHIFAAFSERYEAFCKPYITNDFKNAVFYIISKNIVCGDAQTMQTKNGKPIVFSEWSSAPEYYLKIRDFSFKKLVCTGNTKQTSLSDAGWESSEKKARYIPKPSNERIIMNYRELTQNE